MKITTQHHSVKPHDKLLLCFDVSKTTLNLFSQYHSNDSTLVSWLSLLYAESLISTRSSLAKSWIACSSETLRISRMRALVRFLKSDMVGAVG